MEKVYDLPAHYIILPLSPYVHIFHSKTERLSSSSKHTELELGF